MLPVPRVLTAGDSAIVVEYGDTIDHRVSEHVRRLHLALVANPWQGILESVPTYRSLIVHYDPWSLSREEVERLVRAAASGLTGRPRESARLVEIPVLYGGASGPDLADVASLAGLSETDVVDLHASGHYVVFMLGFMPGFAYMGGLPRRIATPRLDSPRTVVPAGSVGIAGEQTGVYPIESPGGWRLIGRTPVRLFDAGQTPPALFRPGDRVRFVPVGETDYEGMARLAAEGRYQVSVRDAGGGS